MTTQREQLEAMLDRRGWGRTLPAQRPTGLPPDAGLREGPPPGVITELVSAAAPAGGTVSGTTSIALRLAAASAVRGPLAWLDPLDQWDPNSGQRAGVALDHLLWLHGLDAPSMRGLPGLSRWNEILGLVIQSGGMALVIADFLAWPAAELRRIPRSAWFRLLRSLERTRRTGLLLLSPQPITQGCAALVIEAADAKRPLRLIRQRLPASLRAIA